MPYVTTLHIQVNDLRIGDLLFTKTKNGDHYAPVVKIDRKRTRALVTLDDAGAYLEVSLRLDAPVTVDRQQLTDDELDQRRIETGVKRIQYFKDVALNKTPAEFIGECVAKKPERPLDSWNMGDYMEHVAEYEMWKRIEYYEDKYAQAGVESQDGTLSAFADVVLSYSHPRNPLSRSTSVIRNLFDDMENYVIDRARDRVLNYSQLLIEDLTDAQARVRVAFESAESGDAA